MREREKWKKKWKKKKKLKEEEKKMTKKEVTHFVSSSGKVMSSTKYDDDYLDYWLAPIGSKPVPPVNVDYRRTKFAYPGKNAGRRMEEEEMEKKKRLEEEEKKMSSTKYDDDYLAYWLAPIGSNLKPPVNLEYYGGKFVYPGKTAWRIKMEEIKKKLEEEKKKEYTHWASSSKPVPKVEEVEDCS